ncbi:MAG TPA: hypothetical protein VGM80_15025 [Gaiellaceae bacterium]
MRRSHQSAQRGRRRTATLFLLIGTPGTGKRAVGHYLEGEHGFVHLDFEKAEVREEFLGATDAELRSNLAGLRASGRGLVITWSAGAITQLPDVGRLADLGIEPVWFDSDRGAACQAHYADALRPARFHFLDSFDSEGRFRPVEHVVSDLLAPRLRRLRMSRALTVGADLSAKRSTVRRAGSLGARIAGGLALAGGTAFATVALLSGVGSGTPSVRLASAGPSPLAHAAVLPHKGVLVSGRSLAGVKLGDSMAKVRALWGAHFTRCPYSPVMWCYLYPPPNDPVGAGVQFAGGKVVAVFTLGSPTGWRTDNGLRVGETLDAEFATGTGDGSRWLSCSGYSAKATRTGTSVTSILTQGASVYGFALTRPSVSPCF